MFWQFQSNTLIRAARGHQINHHQYSTLRYTPKPSALASVPLEYRKLNTPTRWPSTISVTATPPQSQSLFVISSIKGTSSIPHYSRGGRDFAHLFPDQRADKKQVLYCSGHSHNVDDDEQCDINPQDGLSFMINEIKGFGKILWTAMPTSRYTTWMFVGGLCRDSCVKRFQSLDTIQSSFHSILSHNHLKTNNPPTISKPNSIPNQHPASEAALPPLRHGAPDSNTLPLSPSQRQGFAH